MTHPHHTSPPTSSRTSLQGHSLSWTDDLPVCHYSGVGFSTNQVYREDGGRQEAHEFEDNFFHFRVEDTSLYGVFDGYQGNKVSTFALQRIPAELLLGQLNENSNDKEVEKALLQAFNTVEKGFFESMDVILAEFTDLKLRLAEYGDYEAVQRYPESVDRLQVLESEIASGTTATVTLIQNNKLYVANVGDSRALLVTLGQEVNGGLCIKQLTMDHTMSSEDELLRLSQLSLDVDHMRQAWLRGRHWTTRSIGDYTVKGGYKDCEFLRAACAEPVVAEPHVMGGIAVDESCLFLLMFSSGLYLSLEEAMGTQRQQVNTDIVNMVVTEFATQNTLHGVAQAVVDRVVRLHHDTFMSGNLHSQCCQKRNDITLLVRNFHFPLGGSLVSPTAQVHPVTVPFTPHSQGGTPPGTQLIMPPSNSYLPAAAATTTASAEMKPLHVDVSYIASPRAPTEGASTPQNSSTPRADPPLLPLQLFNTSAGAGGQNSSSGGSSSQEERRFLFQRLQPAAPEMVDTDQPDQDGRIQSYVDFTQFYKLYSAAVQDANQSQ